MYITRNAIEDADWGLFVSMNGGRPVPEHRWAMSRVLGRPLTRRERVDHRDGVRSNNHPLNLRIYLSGKNEEGSCPGYGTYYDEWQRAEARVRELEREIAQLRGLPS